MIGNWEHCLEKGELGGASQHRKDLGSPEVASCLKVPGSTGPMGTEGERKEAHMGRGSGCLANYEREHN